MTESIVSDDLVKKAAAASQPEPKYHAQLCPVWTRRTKGAVLEDCVCWVKPKLYKRTRAALEAVADDLRAEALREAVVAIDKLVAENDSSTSPLDEAYVDGLMDALLVVRKRAEALRSERAQ